MPLDPAVLEREFPEFEFIPERGKIREFALALGLDCRDAVLLQLSEISGFELCHGRTAAIDR